MTRPKPSGPSRILGTEEETPEQVQLIGVFAVEGPSVPSHSNMRILNSWAWLMALG